MKRYMQTMAKVLEGSHSGPVNLEHFDAKYVSVYRNNTITAHIDVLRANYKSVDNLIGSGFFSAICLIYIKEHPARQRSLVGYGEHFTQLLDDNLERHNLAYLSSFAKLDRAWTLAHIARDVEPLEISVLENVVQRGGNLEKFELSLKPDVFLVCNNWPVFPLWVMLRDDTDIKETVELTEQPENVLVWRHGHDVMYRDLNASEFAFLNAVKDGDNLGLATVKALEADPATDVGQLLGGMVAAEIFTIENIT